MKPNLEQKIGKWHAEALLKMQQGLARDAVSLYRKLLKADPLNIQALNNMGTCLLNLKSYDEAIAAFEKGISLNPNVAQLHHNLGLGLHKKLKLDDALSSYEKALLLEPDYADALQNMGAALKDLGRYVEAASCYQKLVSLHPDDENARFMLDSLTGDIGHESAPESYVIELFDNYADHFDRQLSGKLDYRVPEALRQLLAETLGETAPFGNMLDLGCGTGMVAKAFHGTAQRVTGVDLSSRMLEKAAEKNLYTALYQGDIREFISKDTGVYDLVVCADVFIYLGRLDDIFKGLSERMSEGGYLLFSTEDGPDPGRYSLLPSGRYGHCPFYVQSLALGNGFLVRQCRAAPIRKEGEVRLQGNIFILEHIKA